jgi:hypothetical protein
MNSEKQMIDEVNLICYNIWVRSGETLSTHIARRSSQVVRQWSATPVRTGSNPVCAFY